MRQQPWHTLYHFNGQNLKNMDKLILRNEILRLVSYSVGTGLKCSYSPNDPVFLHFSCHLIPLGMKTCGLHLYHFHYSCVPPPLIRPGVFLPFLKVQTRNGFTVFLDPKFIFVRTFMCYKLSSVWQ